MTVRGTPIDKNVSASRYSTCTVFHDDMITTKMIVGRLLSVLLIHVSVLGCLSQQIPSIVKKAIKFAEKDATLDPGADSSALYKTARKWLDDSKRTKDAWELIQFLADEKTHVPSMAKLGHKHAEGGQPRQALHYFQLAAEYGPHHASLYNAGHILAQENAELNTPDWVGALAYLRAGATLHLTAPGYAQESTTKVSMDAYEIVSQQVANSELSLKQSADVFLYGSLHDLPLEAESMWKEAVKHLIRFNDTFVGTEGSVQDGTAMSKAVQSLRSLWESYSPVLSKLQMHLVLDHMNDMLGPLSGLDDKYVPMAGGYAEALATSPYCVEQYAVSEKDPACFNGAASSAMSYYRRAGDDDSAKRILELGRSHPKAATHWDSTVQTPRVYHPKLTSKAWWNPGDFSTAITLSTSYRDQSKKGKILKELAAVKVLQEGKLRGVGGVESLELDVSGNVKKVQQGNGGVQRIFTPYIGVRTEKDETRQEGAGGWAEFGPLFDGISWNEQHCKVVPTICRALQNDQSLCTAGKKVEESKTVWELCGSDTVVTILRLRPGTTILPHCGTTNSRLIMHFALEGADGIEFTVGEKTVRNYGGGDGHAIVFDDSFEHYVHHGGDSDRFVVLAVLAHPDAV